MRIETRSSAAPTSYHTWFTGPSGPVRIETRCEPIRRARLGSGSPALRGRCGLKHGTCVITGPYVSWFTGPSGPVRIETPSLPCSACHPDGFTGPSGPVRIETDYGVYRRLVEVGSPALRGRCGLKRLPVIAYVQLTGFTGPSGPVRIETRMIQERADPPPRFTGPSGPVRIETYM